MLVKCENFSFFDISWRFPAPPDPIWSKPTGSLQPTT